MKKSTKPIESLSIEAEKLMTRIVEEYGIGDEAGLLIIRTAMEAYDRMKGCQAVIAADGITIRDKWEQIKPHPLLPHERDARAAMLAALKALNLDVEPLHDRPGRPTGR